MKFFFLSLVFPSSGLKKIKKRKTFVRKLKEVAGEAENTSSRIKVFFFFFNHIQLRYYSQLREISNGFFPRDGGFLVSLFSTQLLKIPYSSTKCVADFGSSLLPPPSPPPFLLFQQRSHYSPSRQFLPPLNDPL